MQLNETADESQIVKIISQILNWWYAACTPGNIQGAWRAMVCYYAITDGMVIVDFLKSHAIKLLGKEMTVDESHAVNGQILQSAKRPFIRGMFIYKC